MGLPSWKPRRRKSNNPADSDIYCSPGCGSGCLWETFQRRRAEASALRQRLTAAFGGGWTIRVWENMGWHCSVSRAGLHVYLDVSQFTGKVSYSTLMGEPGQLSGKVEWKVPKYFGTPEGAVRAQLRCAKKALDEEARWVALAAGFLDARVEFVGSLSRIRPASRALLSK